MKDFQIISLCMVFAVAGCDKKEQRPKSQRPRRKAKPALSRYLTRSFNTLKSRPRLSVWGALTPC